MAKTKIAPAPTESRKRAPKPYSITFDATLQKKVAGKKPSSAYQSWIADNKTAIEAACSQENGGEKPTLPERSKKGSQMWDAFKGPDKKNKKYLSFLAEYTKIKTAYEIRKKDALTAFGAKIANLPLPEGWRSAINESTGQTYYYARSLDGSSDVSQYERPYVRKDLMAALKAHLASAN